MKTVHLGFEVGTGKPVAIPLRHTAVTGQTQEAGKTTTLEALIARSQLRAVTFITKRGEGPPVSYGYFFLSPLSTIISFTPVVVLCSTLTVHCLGHFETRARRSSSCSFDRTAATCFSFAMAAKDSTPQEAPA